MARGTLHADSRRVDFSGGNGVPPAEPRSLALARGRVGAFAITRWGKRAEMGPTCVWRTLRAPPSPTPTATTRFMCACARGGCGRWRRRPWRARRRGKGPSRRFPRVAGRPGRRSATGQPASPGRPTARTPSAAAPASPRGASVAGRGVVRGLLVNREVVTRHMRCKLGGLSTRACAFGDRPSLQDTVDLGGPRPRTRARINRRSL
jgi:hypothetical protein